MGIAEKWTPLLGSVFSTECIGQISVLALTFLGRGPEELSPIGMPRDEVLLEGIDQLKTNNSLGLDGSHTTHSTMTLPIQKRQYLKRDPIK